MATAKPTSIAEPPASYDSDFAAWSFEQAALARSRKLAEMDWPNLIEELESLGNEPRHSLTSSYRILLVHLLKWSHQPQRRSRSWRATIVRERGNIADRERTNRSLAAKAEEIVQEAYRRARKGTAAETGLPLMVFPEDCPFTLDELRDEEYLPDQA
jgi:hypothetical protein